MDFLIRIFGPPHESLHVLALRVIGRQAKSKTQTYVDIPDDLTLGQYVFVAGLPAFVFWNMAIVGLLILVNAPNLPTLALGIVLLLVGGLAGFGTLGDLQLIAERIMEDQNKPPRDD
jgi:hypothetical protein